MGRLTEQIRINTSVNADRGGVKPFWTAAFIDENGNLGRYHWDGKNQIYLAGDVLAVSGVSAIPSLAGLDYTSIAMVDPGNAELRKYTWFNGTWLLMGTGASVAASTKMALCAMTSSRVAYIGNGKNLQAYDFNGSTWVTVGNALNISSLGTVDWALARLSDDTIAYIDEDNDDLRAYTFDGTDWTLAGELSLATIINPAMATLGDNQLVLISTNAAGTPLRKYTWNGSVFAAAGNVLNNAVSGYGWLAGNGDQMIIANPGTEKLTAYEFNQFDWTPKSASELTLTAFVNCGMTSMIDL